MNFSFHEQSCASGAFHPKARAELAEIAVGNGNG